MGFLEFAEALARICDIANLASDNPLVKNSLFLPLGEKLKIAFTKMIKLCPLAMQETFIFPTEATYKTMKFKPKKKGKKIILEDN